MIVQCAACGKDMKILEVGGEPFIKTSDGQYYHPECRGGEHI